MPSGVSHCAWHQTALFCHPSFSATDSNCKNCTIHARNKNIAQPVWLVWLPAFGPVTPVENAEAQGGVDLLSSELQAQAKNMWGRHNIQIHSTAKDGSVCATLERRRNKVMLQKASFDTSGCEDGPLFLMGKAFKWRNL